MPIRLEAETLHHALARLQEWDHDAAVDARASLAFLGWHNEGPLELRRYDLLMHLWYEVPTKISASLQEKHSIATALGRLLEMTPAADYAPLCSEPQTLDLIALWETSDARARRALGQLLDASGIEPPDTALLAWSSITGLVEAQAREDVAYALEIALEAGTIAPGTAGFKRRQAEIVADVLTHDRLDSIHAERLESWRDDHRSPTRTAIIDRVAETLARPPVAVDVSQSVIVARWLLDRGVDGIGLTQTGALNRALVREAVELRPDWWDTALFGPPNREDEVVPLGRLHDLRLLRRSGRRIVATKRARTLLADPAALLGDCATALLAGDTFEAIVGELAAALMLAGERIEYGSLERAVHPAVVEQGWRSAGVPPSIHAVGATIGRLLAGLEALDLVTGTRRIGLDLAPAGHHALHVGLRARAFRPRSRF